MTNSKKFKSALLVSSLILGVAFSSSAYAVIDANGNEQVVTKTGTRGIAHNYITQSGRSNQVLVNQDLSNSGYLNVYAEQRQGDNNKLSITQAGVAGTSTSYTYPYYSNANYVQAIEVGSSNNLAIKQIGSNLKTSAYITGSNNSVDISVAASDRQKSNSGFSLTPGAAATDRDDVQIQGDRNKVSLSRAASNDSVSGILVGGNDNSASISQKDAANSKAKIYARGSKNNFSISQRGESALSNNLSASISFNDKPSGLGYYGMSDSNKSSIVQSGSDNQASVDLGAESTAYISSYSDKRGSSYSNTSSITQSGNSNIAKIGQSGGFNNASITQGGSFNTASISQVGVTNSIASISQSGSYNSTNIRQVASGLGR